MPIIDTIISGEMNASEPINFSLKLVVQMASLDELLWKLINLFCKVRYSGNEIKRISTYTASKNKTEIWVIGASASYNSFMMLDGLEEKISWEYDPNIIDYIERKEIRTNGLNAEGMFYQTINLANLMFEKQIAPSHDCKGITQVGYNRTILCQPVKNKPPAADIIIEFILQERDDGCL